MYIKEWKLQLIPDMVTQCDMPVIIAVRSLKRMSCVSWAEKSLIIESLLMTL